MMAKQVGLKLNKAEWEQYKELVPARYRMKKLEAFVFNHNVIPNHSTDDVELTFENLRLSKEFLSVIDGHVQRIKEQGISTNRSAVMRYCIKSFLETPVQSIQDEGRTNTQTIKQSSYYFEKGTRSLLDNWIGHRNRSARIEEYLISQNWEEISPEDLENKPVESEPIRINFNSRGLAVLDQIIANLPGETSRSAVMRYAVSRLLTDITGKPFSEVIAHSKLEQSLDQYREVAGNQKVNEMLNQYMTNEN